jgi:hypothetical protein
VLELEKQWAKAVGQERFDDFKGTLMKLVALDSNSADPTEQVRE